jgi:hypothetical protein
MAWVDRIDLAHTHLSDHKYMRVVLRPKAQKPPFRIWRHKDSLLSSPSYIDGLTEATNSAIEEAEELSDARAKWEYIKYKIRRKARALEREIFQQEKARTYRPAEVFR